MTSQQPPMRGRLSRRGVLGMLGAVPLAAAGVAGLAAAAQADNSQGGDQGGHGGTPPGAPPPELLPGGAFDTWVSGLAAQDEFSGTVLLAWHGRQTLVRAFQEADKAKSIPNQPDTIFYLESVTKFLTGVAVTQLAAAGKLDFSAPLGTYLDGFTPDVADNVTVANLLTHTSGYPGSLLGTTGTATTQVDEFNEKLDAARQLVPVKPPGTTYAYSNTNYFLATALVWAASGQYYWDYMPEHVFGPAGMTSSGLYSDDQWLNDPRFAHVYGPAVPGSPRQDLTTSAFGGPDVDEIFSTAPDMLRFATAVNDGTLLPRGWAELRAGGRFPVSLAATADPDAPSTSQSFMIGYGSDERITAGGQLAYGHSGGLHIRAPGSTRPGGANTIITIYPDLGVTAVVLANYSLSAVGDTAGFLTVQDRIITQPGS